MNKTPSVRRHSYRYVAALVIAVAITAAGCGGGGEDRPPPPPPGPLDVGVTISGSSGTVMTLHADNTATIQLLSGKQLTFASPHGSTWTITSHAGATATIQTDTIESKAVTVSGVAGSSVDFHFVNSSDSTEHATVTIRLAVGEFGRVAPRDGEAQEWAEGQRSWSSTVAVFPDGYQIASGDLPQTGLIDEYTRYDENDARTGWSTEDHSCNDEPRYPAVVYPVGVGKSWSYEGNAECTDAFGISHWNEHRSVSSVVTRFETVTVGAGTYYAARIESEEGLMVTGDVDDFNGSGTTNNVCWWATEIGRIIGCEWTRRWNGNTFVSSNELTLFAQ